MTVVGSGVFVLLRLKLGIMMTRKVGVAVLILGGGGRVMFGCAGVNPGVGRDRVGTVRVGRLIGVLVGQTNGCPTVVTEIGFSAVTLMIAPPGTGCQAGK